MASSLKTVNDYLKAGNQLKKEAKLDGAIGQYEQALHLNPDFVPALSQLAAIYESQKQFGKALPYRERAAGLRPKDAVLGANLARTMKSLGKTQEAIRQYEQALHLNPDFVPALSQLAAIYESQKQFGKALPYREKAAGLWPKNAMLKAQLANTMVSLGKTQEAITLYQKAIALNEHLPLWVYNRLGNALAKNGQLEEAIASYEKALELQPDNPNLPNLPQQIAGLKKALEERENQGEIYNKIWKALNQTSLENLEQESANFPTEINPDHVSQYFNVTNQVKIINLASLSEEDKLFIESAGLSLEYLNLNKRLVTKEGVSEEKASQREQNIELQHLAAKDGYIYAVCPSTGKIVQSNRSLFFHARLFFYRFVASEVFYLIFAGVFQKDSLYFPRLELIVHLVPQEMLLLRTKAKAKKQVELCKTEVVQNWTRFKSYFLSMREAKKVVLVGYFFSIWHHLHNELSGLYKAQQAGCLHQIDQFLVVAPEYYCGIDEIFEIDSEKIKRLNAESESKKAEWIIEEVKNEIFENNLFAFSLNEEVLKQYRKSSINVIKLIYQHSLKKCSPAVLAEVEEAKQKYFPLLWINVRLNQRVWLDQEEGIANIVKSLCSHFPNLGVVFDGFTRQERKGSLVVNPHEEQIIKQEKKLVSKIQSLLPQEIKIYNNIGCFMYETIVWAKAIDLCLLSAGSNVTKTQAFNKPDVLHRSNAFAKVHGGTTDWDYIVDVNKGDGKTNYHCDWRVLYKQLFKLASSLKRD
jgi:tetratricopeptide (TPR) repeat protein